MFSVIRDNPCAGGKLRRFIFPPLFLRLLRVEDPELSAECESFSKEEGAGGVTGTGAGKEITIDGIEPLRGFESEDISSSVG